MLKARLRTAVLVLLLASSGAGASSVPDYPFVHVTGSSFLAVVPDIASLDFEIVVPDADPAAARAVLEARVGEVRDLAQQLGIGADDIAVREVRQGMRKEERAASGAPVYELRCDVRINVRNVANWAALAGGLLGKPNLDGFATSFDRTDMDTIHDELVTQAIQDARRRADVMAAAGGRRVGGLMGATPDTLKNLSTAMGLERGEFRRDGGGDRARAQDVDREQWLAVPALKLRQPVDVIFRLENLPRRTR
ncbi:SIMPL domain-containing protein [Massilia kyonggiensis]|nr:SIMPL domain-containing protein [Massilia kyonggiensis]